MKRRIWILTAIICLAVCLAGCCLCGAFADQETITATGSGEGSVRFRVEPEDAEEAYIRGLFGLPVTPVDELPRMRGTTGGDLLGDGTPEKGLYDALKAYALQVANGSRTSTQFTFQDEAFVSMLSFTDEDLGYAAGTPLWEGNQILPEAGSRFGEQISGIVNRAFSAVMFDCPYEMFWINKGSTTYGTSWNYGASYDGSHYYMYINYITLKVAVSGSYAGSGTYTTDGNKISAMTTAAANAHAIINNPDYAGLSATERLAAYKNEICDLTDYNTDAARGEFTRVTGYEYGDPWQLIWVFDNDPDTTVVCEGYSKAFMYLCDETDWGNDNVDAICVTGEMSTWENGVLDGGAHMWNIVTVEGVSYLVDVTNSDQGSIGYSGGLFMDGYDQKDAEGRTYIYETAGGQVIYAYDIDTIQTLAESNKLNVAGTAAATQVQLICDGVADDGGAILLPVHGWLRFTVRADSAIRNEIRGARLVLGGGEEGLNAFELANGGSTVFYWTPNDENGGEMIYTVIAQVKVGEGDNETWISSAPVTVHVTMQDRITEDPEFQTDDQPVAVPLDGMLNIYVGPNTIGADYYGCYIEENGEWIADSRWVIAEPNGEAEVCMPVFRCTPGTTYDAHFYTVKLGAPIKVAQETIQVTVTPKENTEAPIILDVQDKEDDDNPGERICRYTTEERIRVYAYYENPNGLDEDYSWVKVRVYEKGNRGHQITEEDGDGFYFWTDTLRIGEAGTYIIEAEVVQVPNGDFSQPARYVAGTRTRKEITVTADAGKLPTPEAKVPAVARADDGFVIRMMMDGDDMIDRYSFWISGQNDSQWLAGGEISKGQYRISDLWDEDLQAWVYDFAVPAGTLEGNRQYHIYVDTFARGYTQGHNDYYVMLTGDPETDTDVISISGPQQITFSEQFTIHAEAPGARWIAVRCETTDALQYGSGSIANCQFIVDSDPGVDCRFTAVAMYENGTLKTSPTITIPFDRGVYGSNIPVAAAPTLALDQQDADDIHAGQFIRALVGAVNENVTEYVVMIRDGVNEKPIDAVTSPDAGVILLPTSGLKKNHPYQLYAYAHVPGKVRGLSEPVGFTVTDADEEETGMYLNKHSVEVMEPILISFVAPGATGVRYTTASIENDWWQEIWSFNGETGMENLTFFEAKDEMTIVAQANYEGRGWVTIGDETFTVTKRGTLDTPEIDIPYELTEGEDWTILIPEVDGAEEYDLYLDRKDGKSWYFTLNAGTFTIPGSILYAGDYHVDLSARAYGYEPGAFYGDVFVRENRPEPHMTIPAMLTEGVLDGTQAFSVIVDLMPGATDYRLEIVEDGENTDPAFSAQVQAAYEALGTVTFAVPANTLEDGKHYRFTCYVFSTDPDFDDCSASKTIHSWSGDLDSNADVVINGADPGTVCYVGVGDWVNVTATAPGAKAVMICFGDQSRCYAGSQATDSFGLEEPGEVIVYARAYYTEDEEDPELPDDSTDAAWNSLEWGAPSVSRRKIIARIHGQTGQPYFNLPESVARGDMLVVDILQEGDEADEVYANINLGTKDSVGEWVFPEWYSWNGETRKIYLPTAMLEPGQYWLAVDNSGFGKMGNRNWEPFEVTEREDLQAGDILLSVPDRMTEGEAVPVSVYAPGAIRTGFGVDLPVPGEENDYEMHDGEVCFAQIRLNNAGEYTLYAGAQFADGWHYTTKTVEVTPAAEPGFLLSCEEHWGANVIESLLHENLRFSIESMYSGETVFCIGDETRQRYVDAYEYAGFEWYAGETGEYQVYAKMWLPDGEDEEEGRWIYSNRITVSVELADPMPVLGDLTYTVTGSTTNIPQDGVLAIEVDNIGADFYGAYVTDGTNDEWISDTHWVSQNWATDVTLLHLPVLQCEPGDGHDYRVHVYAIRYGVPMIEADTLTPITVAAAGEDAGDLLISIDDNFIASAPVCFYVRYAGEAALPENSRMSVYIYDAGNEDNTIYEEHDVGPLDFWESDLRIGKCGTYELKANIWYYDAEEDDNRLFCSASKTFTVTTDPEGNALTAEFVTPVKSLMLSGETREITFSFTTTNATHCSVELVRVDGNRNDRYGWAETSLWYEERNGVRIPHVTDIYNGLSVDRNGVMTCTLNSWDDYLENGDYEIRICTDAWNYETAVLIGEFTVGGPAFRVYENGILRTVNDETLTGQYYYKLYVEGLENGEYLALSTSADGPWEGMSTDDMLHNENGNYIIVLPPDDKTESCTLFGRVEGSSRTQKVYLQFDVFKVGTDDEDALLQIDEDDLPQLMDPFTLEWNGDEDADAYILYWVAPEDNRFSHITNRDWFPFGEGMEGGFGRHLGMTGQYRAWITVLKNGYAIDHPPVTFTLGANDEIQGEVTFTPAPSATPIEIAQNGFLAIHVNNIDADFYGAYAVDPQVQNGGRLLDTGWVDPQGGDTTTLYLSVDSLGLSEGDRLEVHVYAGKYGAGIKEATGTLILEITDEVLTGGMFEVDLPWDEASNSYLVPAYRDFNIFMYTPGAAEYVLYEDDREMSEWDGTPASGSWEVGPGLHELRYEAYGESGEELAGAAVRVTGTVDEANPDSGIYATVSSVMRIDDEEEPDDFSFTVYNLYRAADEYWQVSLDDQYGSRLWTEGSDYGTYVEPEEEPGEESGQEFTIPGSNFSPNRLYLLTVEAHAEGKNPYRKTFLIRTYRNGDTFNGNSADLSLTVNGQAEEAEGPAGSYAYISITAPGATALRLHKSGSNEAWDYLYDYKGNGRHEWRETFGYGERVYYVEACYDEPEADEGWDDMNWTAGSNAVTVRGIVGGNTTAPTVTLAGGAVDAETGVRIIPRSEPLTVVISAPVAPEDWPAGQEYRYDATRFSVRIMDEDGNDYYGGCWLEDVTEFPVLAGINITGLEAGRQFTVRVEAAAPGKYPVNVQNCGWFEVTDEGATTLPTLSIMKAPDAQGVYHILQGEHVQILGTVPGAESVTVQAHYTGDTDGQNELNKYDLTLLSLNFYEDEYPRPEENSFNEIVNETYRLEPGMYEFYAVAAYDDMENSSAESNRLRVSVEMRNTALLKPEILLDSAVVNPDDELTFTVTNLAQPGANNWEVYVEEDWNYGDENIIFHRSSNSYFAAGDDGSVTFTVPVGALENDTRYIIRTGVNGIGYEHQDASAQFLAKYTEGAGEPRLTVSVSRTSVPIKEEFEITICDTADPEEDPDPITGVLLNKGDDRFELIWLDNGVYSQIHHFDEPGQRLVSVKYTTDEFDPYTDDPASVSWISGGVAVMNATVQGVLPKPVFELNKTTGIVQGDVLKVTVTDPEGMEGANIWYYADIDRACMYDWGWNFEGIRHIDAAGRSKTILIPTRDLEPGKYRIGVGMGSDGCRDTHASICIWIEEPEEEIEDFLFMTDRTALTVNEDMTLYFYAADAERLEVNITKAGDAEWQDGRDISSDEGRWSWCVNEPGIYTMTPTAYYADNSSTTGDAINVTVTAPGGTISITDMTMVTALPLGSDLTVAVTATQTDPEGVSTPAAGVLLEMLLGDEFRNIYKLDRREIILDENGQATVTFDKDLFQLSGIYKVKAETAKAGCTGIGREKRLTVVPAQTDTQHTVTLTVDGRTDAGITIPSSKQFNVRVNAPGAYAVRLMRENDWDYASGTSLEETRGYGDGDVSIVAMASYTDPETLEGIMKPYSEFDYDDWNNFTWDMVSWTGVSNTIEVHISNLGTLGTPNYTLSDNSPNRGETLVVNILADPPLPEGAPADLNIWYYADLERAYVDGDGRIYDWYHYDDWNWGWDEQARQIRIPTEILAPGVYRIRVGIDAEGWQAAQRTAMITVEDAPDGTFMTSMAENEVIPIYGERNYMAMISGAEGITRQLMRLNEDTGIYEEYEEAGELTGGDYGHFRLYFSTPGSYRMIFRGMVNGTEITESVDFTVVCYGTLSAPKIQMNDVWTSGGLQFTVLTDEQDTELYVSLTDWNGMYENVTTYDHSFSYSADMFVTGRDYCINVSHSKEGYYGNSSQVVVRRIAANKTMRLPAALLTIENEAFANIAAELVIIPDNTESIGENAFDCGHLRAVYIPDSVTSIDPYAFGYGDQMTVYGHEGSYAESFANAKGYYFVAVN